MASSIDVASFSWAVEDWEGFDSNFEALYTRIVTTGGRASVSVRFG